MVSKWNIIQRVRKKYQFKTMKQPLYGKTAAQNSKTSTTTTTFTLKYVGIKVIHLRSKY